jgi:hypothetical protein
VDIEAAVGADVFCNPSSIFQTSVIDRAQGSAWVLQQ